MLWSELRMLGAGFIRNRGLREMAEHRGGLCRKIVTSHRELGAECRELPLCLTGYYRKPNNNCYSRLYSSDVDRVSWAPGGFPGGRGA